MWKITDMHELIVLKYWFSYCFAQMVLVINIMLFFFFIRGIPANKIHLVKKIHIVYNKL